MQLFTVSTKNVFLVFLLHQLFSFQNLRSKLQLFKWSESFFYYFVIAAVDCFLSLLFQNCITQKRQKGNHKLCLIWERKQGGKRLPLAQITNQTLLRVTSCLGRALRKQAELSLFLPAPLQSNCVSLTVVTKVTVILQLPPLPV